MYDLIIKNGYVVSPSSTVKCDIAVSGKKIAGLGTYSGSEGKRVIDAEGSQLPILPSPLLLPALVYMGNPLFPYWQNP